jgi:hypothetical protein
MIPSVGDDWECTDDVGILVRTNGKRMYGCSQCAYVNNRLYHTKMHHQRIHIEHGRASTRRRKFEGRSGPSVPVQPPQAQKLRININSQGHQQLKLLCRRKIATASRNALHSMRRTVDTAEIPLHAEANGCSFFQQVLSFGEFAITPGLQDFVGSVHGNTTFDTVARRQALCEIAAGFEIQAVNGCFAYDLGSDDLLSSGQQLMLPSKLQVAMCEKAQDATGVAEACELSADGGEQGGGDFVPDVAGFMLQ